MTCKRDVSEGAEDECAVSKKRHVDVGEASEVLLGEKDTGKVAAEDTLTSTEPCKPDVQTGNPVEHCKPDVQTKLVAGKVESPSQQTYDHFYFRQYGDLSCQELMLRDRPRMEAYVRAIASSSEMADKVVMDVGSGSGFLALMCATQGKAKHVHAVEANVKMANIVRDLVSKNGLEDKITIWDCTVEDLIAEESDRLDVTSPSVKNLLRKGSVDIIVSEWMGFYLFHEAMLDSVLLARDHFLLDGEVFSDDDVRWAGKNILPRVCELFTAPLDFSRWEPDHDSNYFENLYGLRGFDRYFGHHYPLEAKKEPRPRLATWVTMNVNMDLGIQPQDMLVTTPAKILTLDLMRTQIADLRSFHFPNIAFPKSEKPGLFGGVGIWFDCVFTDRSGAEVSRLKTGPEAPQTHWRQTVVDIGDVIPVEAGEAFTYELKLEQSVQNKRFYNISLAT